MALLYRTFTIDAMWAALEASTPFTTLIAQARRVTDTRVGWLKKLVLRAPGDFPHVQIGMGDNFTGSGPTFTNFSDEGSAPTGEWDEERTSEFKLSFFYELAGFDKQDELEMTAIEAFETAGRNLGYPPIYRWGPWRGKRDGKATPLDDGIVRPVTQIIIPVSYRFAGSTFQS